MAPLVSVLLPTRNRLKYLAYAIESVRRQPGEDWEIIVSDNASEEDIAGHVEALGDERIRYRRTAAPVSVTENWNNALAGATGRYAVMLGDDDALMPGYLTALLEHVDRFENPELIYTGAWLYAYPGVFPDAPDGYLKPYGYAEFMRGRTEPFVLDRATARAMVRAALRFRVRYGFNMQFSTLSRSLIDKLTQRGPLFQSAFPDYYATNAAFLTSARIVVDPRPLVAIGVTPKSYGFFHANRREDQGRAFLGAPTDERTRAVLERTAIPGTYINVGWLSALESLRTRFGADLPAKPSHLRFRMLQAAHVYEERFHGRLPRGELDALRHRLPPAERAFCDAAYAAASAGGRLLPPRLKRAFDFGYHRYLLNQYTDWDPAPEPGRYSSLLDVFDREAGGRPVSA